MCVLGNVCFILYQFYYNILLNEACLYIMNDLLYLNCFFVYKNCSVTRIGVKRFTIILSLNIYFLIISCIIFLHLIFICSSVCELISRRESSVNTRLGSDQHQLIMPPISKDCSNTFLERSFIYAAPCEWNKLSECVRTSSFDSFRKSVKTMLFTQQYGC